MNKPVISKDFTIDDIHKLREFNAEERDKIGKTEYNKILNEKVAEFLNIDVETIPKKATTVV